MIYLNLLADCCFSICFHNQILLAKFSIIFLQFLQFFLVLDLHVHDFRLQRFHLLLQILVFLSAIIRCFSSHGGPRYNLILGSFKIKRDGVKLFIKPLRGC